jgi:hypothetical protein
METKMKSASITWGKRIVLVVIVLAGVFYGILNMAERSKDSIRLGLQDYMEKTTGQKAVITEMSTVELSPDIECRMGGIIIKDRNDDDKTLLSIEKAYVGMPFLGMAIGQKSYIGFEIQNADIASGFFFPKKMMVSFAGISDPMPDTKDPYFLAEGRYNDRDAMISFRLNRKADNDRYLYSVPSLSGFTFKIGETEASGLVRQELFKVSLENLVVTNGPYRADLNIRNISKKTGDAAVEGSINSIPVKGSLNLSGENIVLTIDPQTENTKDIQEVNKFAQQVREDLGIVDGQGGFQIKTLKPNEEKNGK